MKRTQILSLYLSTHTHTQQSSRTFSRTQIPLLRLSLTHTRTHSDPSGLSDEPRFFCYFSLTHTHAHTAILTDYPMDPDSCALSLSLSLSHTHTHTAILAYYLTNPDSFALSLSHTHTHTQQYSRTISRTPSSAALPFYHRSYNYRSLLQHIVSLL